MNLRALLIAAGLAAAPACAAEPHHCQADALDRAGKLLRFYFEMDGYDKLAAQPGPPDESGNMAWSLDEKAEVLAPVSAPGTSEKYDVLQVMGYIYKATYRMRLLYVQMPDDCALAGLELIGS